MMCMAHVEDELCRVFHIDGLFAFVDTLLLFWPEVQAARPAAVWR